MLGKHTVIVLSAMILATAGASARGVQHAAPTAPYDPNDPSSVSPQDEADSLYRAARAELRERNYQRSAELFGSLRSRFPNSSYVAQSMYWEAFALNRVGDEDALQRGLELLGEQERLYPDDVSADARSLYVQMQGQLARRGDRAAAEILAVQADAIDEAARRADARSDVAAERAAMLEGMARRQGYSRAQSEDDVRMQALNALMHMDADAAIPILRRVLANRSADNVAMRRQAVFLVSQKRSVDREQILIDVVRNDPDAEVRSHAVFHLSQVRTPAAVAALDSILQFSEDRTLQERALFALSQHRSDEAANILRSYAERGDAPMELRGVAIQWLGQNRANTTYLRTLYGQLVDSELKEKALFALSQSRDEASAQFLLEIALDQSESIEVRKRALFWVGQMRVATVQLYELYDRTTDTEMKEQLIFVYGQRGRNDEALDKLIDIVRNETDPHLRGRAIFWLGQTRNPRAIAVLEEIINR